MTISTYPATPVPLLASGKYQEQWADINSRFGESPGGRTFTNSLVRFPSKIFNFSYLDSATNRNSFRSFMASARRQGNRFWTFWPVSLAAYDQYIGQGGPWELTGCMVYDASAVTYTDETDDANNATASDVSVHPTAGTGDEIIIMADYKFDIATVTIATAGAGTYTISGWTYSKNDGTWAALTVTDNTTNFKAAAGARTVTFTIPTDWDTVTVNNASGYAIKATFDAGTVTTPPLVTTITVNSKTFDLPFSSGAAGTTTIYENTTTTLTGGGTDYTFVSAGGGGGSDRMTLTAYPTQGDLFTCDYTAGKARILGYFVSNDFEEGFPSGDLHTWAATIMEDRR